MNSGPLDFHYKKWDGSQQLPLLEADALFDEIRDSLLYHGDVAAALKKLLADGFTSRDGRQVEGLRNIISRLAERRRQILAENDPSGILQEISDALEAIRATETEVVRSRIDDLNGRSDRASDEAVEALNTKLLELDTMASDPVSQVHALKEYDFVSSEAAAAFEKLMQDISQKLLDSFFSSMKNAMQVRDPQELARTREMMGALNSLLSNHREGADTKEEFEEFMKKWGENFPPGIADTQALVDFLTAQMKASAAMFNSLSPEQRRELMDLSQELLGDLDLGWQMDQLSQNLAPFMGTGTPRYGFHGDRRFGLGEAPGIFGELGELSDLESFLRQVSSPTDLADVDLSEVEKTLGEDARQSLEALSKLASTLEESGLISSDQDQLQLTPKAMRQIGESVLRELFSRPDDSLVGDHSLRKTGQGMDLEYDTKPYEFGDPFNLNINTTIRNALRRGGGGVPIAISPDDFEIERTEQLTKASTILLLDLSLSMPLRDNFLSAKKVAMALNALITAKFPKDFLAIVGFSEVARRIEPQNLPEVSWDYVYGTNMEHALLMARDILRSQTGTKQILMITDGEPTAHIMAGGDVFFSYPSTPETISATLKEVMRCTREGIKINSFVLDATAELKRFMDKFASINKGKVFYTDPDDLGSFVLVDYLTNKSTAASR